MSKKLVYTLALAVILLATAGLGTWGVVTANEAQEDQSSNIQTGRPWLGVTLANINSRLAERLELSQNEGVVILNVTPGSPAEQAGLQAKDILFKIGPTDIDTIKKAVSTLSSYKVGDSVTLIILRDGKQQTKDVKLAAAPLPSALPKFITPPQVCPWLGLPGLDLPQLPKQLNLEGIEQSQLFDYYLGAQIKLKDKDGNPVTVQSIPGTVASVSDITLVINKNEDGPVTWTVPADAAIRKGLKAVKLSDLQVGDKVMVVTVNDQVKAILAGQDLTIWPRMHHQGFGLPRGPMEQPFGPQFKYRIGEMFKNPVQGLKGLRNRLQEYFPGIVGQTVQ